MRLLAAELGEHGVKVNGINPDGVVRGSGIFAGGWGAKRAAVYGVPEEDLGKYYAQRTLLKREVLPEHVANAVFVLCSADLSPHHRPAHPGRRGRRRGLPPMTTLSPSTGAATRLTGLRGHRHRRLQRPGGRRAVGRRSDAPRGRCTASPTGRPDADGHLRWNLTGLYARGAGRAAPTLAERYPDVVSLGIDTWAVDYGLLDADGRLLAEPIAYRDDRTEAVIDDGARPASTRPGCTRSTACSSCRSTPSTSWRPSSAGRCWTPGTAGPAAARPAGLLADRRAADRDHQRLDHRAARRPDPHLVGRAARRARTSRPTCSRRWSSQARSSAPSDPTRGRADRPAPRRRPWSRSGRTTPPRRWSGCRRPDDAFAYVSSGTWSLVGVELDQPVLTEDSRAANFTNEGGVDGRVRYLRNVGGLWLLQESLRTWREAGSRPTRTRCWPRRPRLPSRRPGGRRRRTRVPAAGRHAGPDPRGLRGGRAAGAGRRPSRSSAASSTRWPVRTRETVAAGRKLSGQPVDVVHIVGGGCQNELLCQLTADLSGRPVLAGPVEATALGNVAVQARTAGAAVRRPGGAADGAARRPRPGAVTEPAATAATVAAEVG